MKNFGFGVMRLPLFDDSDSKNVDYDKAYEMIKLYMDSGFSYFDTGYMYHNYYSENVLRDILVKRFTRESFQHADKLPVFSLKNKEAVPLIFDEQLRRCGVDYFDYYLLHCLSAEFYDPKCEPFGCFEFIAQKKREGKVREIGFSYHDKAELLDRILTEHPEVDFVQLQINYLDWEDEKIQSRIPYALFDYDVNLEEEALQAVCRLVQPERLTVWMYLDKPNFSWLTQNAKVSPERFAMVKRYARVGIANINNPLDVKEALDYFPDVIDL